MENLLAGKNVFINGAGAGMGRGHPARHRTIALEMAAQGANINFVEINRDRRAALERELNDLGARAGGYIYDVSQPAAIDEVCESLNSQSIVTDVLVKNVGVSSRRAKFANDFSATDSFENWQSVMNTNIVGPLHLTRRLTQKRK